MISECRVDTWGQYLLRTNQRKRGESAVPITKLLYNPVAGNSVFALLVFVVVPCLQGCAFKQWRSMKRLSKEQEDLVRGC